MVNKMEATKIWLNGYNKKRGCNQWCATISIKGMINQESQLELCWAGEFVGSEGVKEITVL